MDPRAPLTSAVTAAFARQLGRPSGLAGRLVAHGLDRHNRATVTAAVAALEPAPGQTLGDVGFGGGLGLRLLLDHVGPDGRVWGVDRSAPMVRRAWRRHRHDVRSGRLRLEEGSLTSLPLPDTALDGVLTTNTFYFVADLPRACAELARVVRPGGRVAVGIGDPEAMAAMPVTAHGFRLRPVAEVVATLAGAGLDLVGHSRVGPEDDAYHVLAARRAGTA